MLSKTIHPVTCNQKSKQKSSLEKKEEITKPMHQTSPITPHIPWVFILKMISFFCPKPKIVKGNYRGEWIKRGKHMILEKKKALTTRKGGVIKKRWNKNPKNVVTWDHWKQDKQHHAPHRPCRRVGVPTEGRPERSKRPQITKGREHYVQCSLWRKCNVNNDDHDIGKDFYGISLHLKSLGA